MSWKCTGIWYKADPSTRTFGDERGMGGQAAVMVMGGRGGAGGRGGLPQGGRPGDRPQCRGRAVGGDEGQVEVVALLQLIQLLVYRLRIGCLR